MNKVKLDMSKRKCNHFHPQGKEKEKQVVERKGHGWRVKETGKRL